MTFVDGELLFDRQADIARRPALEAERKALEAAEANRAPAQGGTPARPPSQIRSEEHTSELQSRQYLVCRLLLEKKKNKMHLINLKHPNQINYTSVQANLLATNYTTPLCNLYDCCLLNVSVMSLDQHYHSLILPI